MTQRKCLLVSVVICAYNGEKLIHSCLSSLVAQTAPSNRYEVLIIDDESKDNTFEVGSDFINSQKGNTLNMRLARIRHGGLSVARNTGIQMSKGEIIAFIDQDAVAVNNWLESIINCFENNLQATLVSGKTLAFDKDNNFTKFIVEHFYNPSPGNKSYIGTNMSFKKSFFDKRGGFIDYFDRRGDESALVIFRNIADNEIIYDQKIMVYHHFPEKLNKWLKEKQENGRLLCIIRKMTNGDQKPTLSFRDMLKYSYFMIPFVLFCSAFLSKLLIVAGFLFLIFLARIARATFQKLKTEKNIKQKNGGCLKFAIVFFCLKTLETINHEFGYLREWFFGRKLPQNFLYSSYHTAPRLADQNVLRDRLPTIS